MPSPNKVPGVEFTTIQNLNPNAPATNRAVKRKWAVVVGAGRFQEGRLTSSTENDMDQSAREFYNYLVDEQAGRFDRSHVKLLVNNTATRQNIMSALGPEWLGAVTGPDDLVVVYIATNAFPTTDGNTYLCAYDCALDNIYGTCVSMQNLMDTLRKSVHCDRILLVLQAAYSGAAEIDSGAKDLYKGYNVDLDKVMLGKGYVILSSSQPNEITWNSAFSRNLIAALRTEGGMVPLQKAFAMARDKTASETMIGHPERKQTPAMKADWKGTDLVVGTPPLETISALPSSVTTFLSAETCYLKATQLLSAGNISEALKEYKNAITVDPNYADALADYGATLTLNGNWQDAATMYERAIAVHPNDELFYVNYARVLEKLGKEDQCKTALEKAYSLNNKDMSVLTALASRYLTMGQYTDAVRYLEEAVKLYPAYSDLHERLSYAYARAGDVDAAVTEAQQAVKLNARSASAQLNLGSALMIQGDARNALPAYQAAARLTPDNPEVHYLISRCMEKLGDRDGAKLELALFIKLCAATDPRLTTARIHLKEL
ncbi:MAG: tetratricopeptide repeat protein [Cyanobacteria bacterium SZAS TMP-1]|nr:tetratricopeptide repeat protein [Cyanobacteria bacterium SZAS TMP-1]